MAKKQVIRLTEGDLHRIIKESINNVLTELNWKTYASAAKKARELGRDSRWDFDRATERALKGEYGEDVGVATDNDTYQRFRGYSNYPNIKDAWIPLEGHEDFGAYSDFPTNKEMGKDISDYVHGRSEYIKGKGWAKK